MRYRPALAPVAEDLNGLRIGTPEIVRWGIDERHADEIAGFIADALGNRSAEDIASKVTVFRKKFNKLHYIAS